MARICDNKECTETARWVVGLQLWAPYKIGKPATATTSIWICDIHKETIKIDDIISDEGWEQIVFGFKSVNKVEPERNLTELHFISKNEFN